MNARFVPRSQSGPASRIHVFAVLLLLAGAATMAAWPQSAATTDLPDAPHPVAAEPVPASTVESSSAAAIDLHPDFAAAPFSDEPDVAQRVPVAECPDDETRARECRVHWHQLMIEATLYDAFQNAGNLYTGYWYRYETTHGKWLDRYFNSDLDWRWNRWKDNNPVLDDYVGHPMMGSITNYMWIQNDPKGMTVDFGNNREYWKSRMRALAFSTVFSMQWKFGPFGEAAIGHNGDHYFIDNGVRTNGTGWVELITTPFGGLGWTIAEDALDKHLVRKLEAKPRRPVTLLFISFLTPSKATANILRFRPPWYRDGYVVKAAGFWSDPVGANGPTTEPGDANTVLTNPDAAAPSGSTGVEAAVVRSTPALQPEWPRYGGVHEFGAWWGLSLISGHIWGYAPDVKYMPVDVNYSYLLNPQSHRWAFRYAPEITALAMLDEINQANKATKYTLRQRSYGSGISPVGFRASFYPDSRVQPYVSGDGGFLYFFNNRVLSPEGSQFIYTIDYGAGLTFFRKKRQSFSIGYRYQHLSNANISQHNPGTDANTFYIQVSRYRTKGYR
jgi:hypothetical protein